ncbi:MAG: filamentous hemagglutinin N-terminal domain-containing protein, partial [Cyanobacteria bacterium P01_A01_bin.135]
MVTIRVGLVSLLTLCVAGPAWGQSRIVPDDTLGAERSLVFENVGGTPNEVIDGGARRGQNLFHSFEAFNVSEGRGAFFFSPDGLENIFSRVTGGNASNILGMLGTFAFGGATPNLYLMNPNGILFGSNSSLDVGGSFAAVTADGIQFGERGVFSAARPAVPSGLLTVDPSAFLFSGAAGEIVNRSVVPDGLRVPNGENLLLLGRDVEVRGDLSAFGGRIDVGAVGTVSAVGLRADGALTFPQQLERGDVIFTDGALVRVALDDAGDIAVTAQNINILEGSVLAAGIAIDSGKAQSQAGDITLDASEAVRVVRGDDAPGIQNIVSQNVTGSAGNIEIMANVLEVRGGAGLVASTLGQGNAGSVIISAADQVTFAGTSEDGQFISGASSQVAETGIGAGGNIEITTGVLEMRGGAQLAASTSGQGDAGSVIISATDRVTFTGTSADGQLGSAALSRVNAAGNGTGGDIEITTGVLEVRGGAQLVASTRGQGGAGNVIISATDRVTFADRSEGGQLGSGAFSTVEETSVGAGGDIEITTGVLEVRGGAQLAASTLGQGNAGSVI